jgi:hypothetical protein
MAVRNFWIDADIDGRQTMLSGGPKSRNGGMTVNIYQRDCSQIIHPVTVNCYEDHGKLIVSVSDETGMEVFRKVTER